MKNLFKALTIKERYEILQRTNISNVHPSLLKWRQEMSIISENTFNEMLKTKSLNKNIFSHAICYQPEFELQEKYQKVAAESDWYKFYDRGIKNILDSNETYDNFSNVIRPFIENIKIDLKQLFFRDSSKNIFSTPVFEQVILYITNELSEIVHKTLVLELNLEKEQGLLIGESPEERYMHFVKSFDQIKKLNAFFDKYMVITRLLSSRSLFFIDHVNELVNRIVEDQKELMCEFRTGDLKIIGMKFGEGDTHQEGRTVTVLELLDSTKIVYKPKDLKVNKVFNDFINYMNGLNYPNFKSLKTLPTLNKYTYSYELFIEQKYCESIEEIEDFYHRFGQLMAIFQILNGTDIHMENLISHGSHPVIIDLETLIQRQNPLFGQEEELTLKEIRDRNFKNVTRTLFLPTNGLKTEKLDLSALNGRESKLDYKVLQPVNQGTDEMRYEYKEFILKGSKNLPTLENDIVEIDYKHYKNQILTGFQAVYEMIIKNKAELLNSKVLEKFKNLKVRVLFRDTNQYATILMHMQHPQMLMDMLDREKALENMWVFPYADKSIIDSETRDMIFNDIPVFFNVTNSLHIEGNKSMMIENYYDYTPYEYLLTTFNEVSESELQHQLSVIQLHFGDFSSVRKKELSALETISEPFSKLSFEWNEQIVLNEIYEIADSIIEKAIDLDHVSWIIPSNQSDDDVWSLAPSSDDFYNGSSGILLFYYHLYNQTGIKKYKEFYQKLLAQCNPELVFDYKLGLSGYPAYLHAFSYMNDFKDDNAKILKLIIQYCSKIEEILNDKSNSIVELDYLNGITSLIGSLIRLYEHTKMSRVLELAIKCGDFLVNKNVPIKDPSFGHGEFGKIVIIKRLFNLTQIKKYNDFANSLLSNIDIPESLQSSKSLHWCTGCLGIDMTKNEVFDQEMQGHKIFVNNYNRLENKTLMNNDSICHGNMSLVEYFLTSSDTFEKGRSIGMAVIKLKNNNSEYKLMHNSNFEDISLFTGTSGIGYQLLRLINPEEVPSILS